MEALRAQLIDRRAVEWSGIPVGCELGENPLPADGPGAQRLLMSYKKPLVRHKGAVYNAFKSGAAVRRRIVQGSQ